MATQTPAESSPAEVERSPIEVVESLSDADRAEWLKSGKLPAAPAEDEESAPSTAPEKATAEPEEAEPESAPGKKEESDDEESSRRSPAAERRIKQLLARVKELEDKVQAATPKEAKVERAQKPKLTSFSTIEDYEAAMDVWTQAEIEIKAQEALAKQLADKEKADKDAAIEAANKEIEKQWKAKVTASTKKHADFLEVASKAPLIEKSVADAFILDSEMGAELLYHFGAHPEELERINEIENKISQVRELTKLESKLSESPAPVRKVSGAPKPPSEVGARGTPVEDPVADALANKDFEAYAREQNAKERRARAAR